MKASKFTDAQKAFIINLGEEGVTVAEICLYRNSTPSKYQRHSVSLARVTLAV